MSRSSGCQQPPFGEDLQTEDLQNDEIPPFWGRSLTDAFQNIVFSTPTKTCSHAPRPLFRNERSRTETGGFELNPGEHESRGLREPLLGLIRRQFPSDGEDLGSTEKKPYHDERNTIRVLSMFRNFLEVCGFLQDTLKFSAQGPENAPDFDFSRLSTKLKSTSLHIGERDVLSLQLFRN
jgi:hypothetical protein